VAGVLAQIVGLTQKLQERPTPKFYRRGDSCDRASRRILIAGLSLGDWALAPKKKMAAVWAGHNQI